VRQDVVEHDARAAAMLLRGLDGGATSGVRGTARAVEKIEHETRPAKLVVRRSTQPVVNP
jgi:hypothetical protein